MRQEIRTAQQLPEALSMQPLVITIPGAEERGSLSMTRCFRDATCAFVLGTSTQYSLQASPYSAPTQSEWTHSDPGAPASLKMLLMSSKSVGTSIASRIFKTQ